MIISHGQGCVTTACLQESLQASQHSALLLWIPALPDRFRSFPRQGWDESKSRSLLCPSQRVGYSLPRAHSSAGREAEEGRAAARQCQLTPWHSLQGLRSGREAGVQPTAQEGRVLPGKLKESGRVEHSFVWKDDAEKLSNVGIK